MIQEVKKAKKRLDAVIKDTPFTLAKKLSEQSGATVYLKKENLQETGSFKLRGAFNKIASLHEKGVGGVIAASAGNHAQGVAFAAKHFGMGATIVMPDATPLTKVNGVEAYGAKVVLFGKNFDEAYAKSQEIARETGYEFVHPFADDAVIAGQGTIALDMLEQVSDLDVLVVPVGGGGLISGIAMAAKAINPDIKVYGVAASGAPAMRDSFYAQKPIDSVSVKTIADGIAVRDTSPKTLEYIIQNVDDIFLVDDEEIANAILFLLEKQKLVVEGAGAAGVAALMHEKIPNVEHKKVATVLSGGNIDVTMLSVIIEKGLLKSHRKMKLIVTLIDRPGSLMQLTDIFSSISANIVQIGYDRTSTDLKYGDAYVSISLETKGSGHQEQIKQKLTQSGFRFKEEL
ncbi:MAG: threonine ammonia-lyase [Campylobacterota bacterium]